MISKPILTIISARGGSKRLPGKNIKLLNGKPLIAWTIEAAIQSDFKLDVYVSTDSEDIARVAIDYGAKVPSLRPSHLAQDNTPGVDPVLYMMEQFPFYDEIVLLQPTSPLRTKDHISSCLRKYQEERQQSCLSVCEPLENKNLVSVKSGKITFREDTGATKKQLNGAIYAASREHLIKNRTFLVEGTSVFEMPQEFSVDVDDFKDFEKAEEIMKSNRTIYEF